MTKEANVVLGPEQQAKLAHKKAQLLAQRQKKKLFHSKNSLLVSKKEKIVKKIIATKSSSQIRAPAGNDENLLLRETSSKIEKIRKHTKFLINLDKYAIRDRVEALRAYFTEKTESKERLARNEDLIELVITISKVLAKVTIKPLKIPVVHPVQSPEQKGLSVLVVKDSQIIGEEMKDFAKSNRVSVEGHITLR